MKFFANAACNVYSISKIFALLARKCYDEWVIMFRKRGEADTSLMLGSLPCPACI